MTMLTTNISDPLLRREIDQVIGRGVCLKEGWMSRWRVAGHIPRTLKVAGEYDPREAGRKGELQAPGVIGDNNCSGDVERCVVLGESYALLLKWTALKLLAGMTELSPLLRRGIVEDG